MITKTFNKIDVLNNWFSEPEIIDVCDLLPQRDVNRTSTDYIVIHHDSIPQTNHIPIMDINNYHISKGWYAIAYHYYIAKNGKIFQLHANDAKGTHCKNYNDVSISICLNGCFDTEQPTDKQEQSLTKLSIHLIKLYPEAQIVGHRDQGYTRCPGANMDIKQLNTNVANYHFLKELIK